MPRGRPRKVKKEEPVKDEDDDIDTEDPTLAGIDDEE
jgi:hypothetical protein